MMIYILQICNKNMTGKKMQLIKTTLLR